MPRRASDYKTLVSYEDFLWSHLVFTNKQLSAVCSQREKQSSASETFSFFIAVFNANILFAYH